MAIQTSGGEMQLILRVRDDGTAVVEKFADSTDKSAKKSGKAFDDTASSAGASFSRVGMYAGIAATVIATTAVAMVKMAIDTADATAKTSRALGTTTEAFSAMAYAAEAAAGMTRDQFGQSLNFMQNNLSMAAQGLGDARYAIQDLGLNVDALAKMRPEQKFEAIVDAMNKFPDAAGKIRIARDIFGLSGAEIVKVSNDGAEGLHKLYAEAENAGRVIAGDTAKAAEQFNDNLQRLKANAQGLAMSIAGPLMTALNAFFEMGRAPKMDLQAKFAATTREIEALNRELQRTEPNSPYYDAIKHQIESMALSAANLNKEMQTAAAAAAAGQKPGGGGLDARQAEEAQKIRDEYLQDLSQRATLLNEGYRSEQQQLLADKQAKLSIIKEAEDMGVEIGVEYKTLREQIELEHQAKLGDISAQGILARQAFDRMTLGQQAKSLAGWLAATTATAATHNKSMFELNKAAGIANAIISMHEGIGKAWAMGPILGPIMAGIILAAGTANIAAIAATSFGSTTSAPSVGAGGAIPVTQAGPPAMPESPAYSQPAQQSQGTIQIVIQGNLIGNEEFIYDTLVPVLREGIDNRDIVIIGQDSRQAQNLAAA